MAKLPAKPNAAPHSLSQALGDLLRRALGPAADESGRAVGELTKTYFDDLERQRVENLTKHKEQVEEHLREPSGPAAPRDVKRLIDWVEGAQDSGDEDPDLAAMWRLTLEAIYRKEYDVDHILDKVRQLRGPEAEALLSMKPRWSRYDFDDYLTDGLVRHGLIEKYQMVGSFIRSERGRVISVAALISIALLVLWFGVQSYLAFYLKIEPRQPHNDITIMYDFMSSAVSLMACALGLVVIVFAVQDLTGRVGSLRPTTLGERIIELSRKYVPKRPGGKGAAEKQAMGER